MTAPNIVDPAGLLGEALAGGRRYLGLDVLARCRLNTVPDTDSEMGADTMPALSA